MQKDRRHYLDRLATIWSFFLSFVLTHPSVFSFNIFQSIHQALNLYSKFQEASPNKSPKSIRFCVCVFLNARFHPLNWLLGLLVFKSQASTVTGCCQDLTITSAQQQLDLTTGKFSLRIAAKAWVFPGRVIREMVLGKHASCLITSSTLTFFFGGVNKNSYKIIISTMFWVIIFAKIHLLRI